MYLKHVITISFSDSIFNRQTYNYKFFHTWFSFKRECASKTDYLVCCDGCVSYCP